MTLKAVLGENFEAHFSSLGCSDGSAKPDLTHCAGAVCFEGGPDIQLQIVGVNSVFIAEAVSLLIGILMIDKSVDLTLLCDNLRFG